MFGRGGAECGLASKFHPHAVRLTHVQEHLQRPREEVSESLVAVNDADTDALVSEPRKQNCLLSDARQLVAGN